MIPPRETLPTNGLLVAYDFTRKNFLNWSEELTQSVWSNPDGRLTRIPSGSNGTIVASNGAGTALLRQNVPAMTQGQVWSVGFCVTLLAGPGAAIMIDGGDGVGAYITPTATRTFFQVNVTVGSVGKWLDLLFPAAASTYLIEQIQANPGDALLPYERTTDGQTLVDRGVRLWPAPAARTNLVRWSDDPLASTWASGGSTPTITPNTATTPRGHPAWTITGGWRASSAQNYAGVKLTSACVMKGTAGSATTFFVFPKGVGQSITVDVNGTVTSNSLVDGAHSVTPLGGGWFEVALTYTPDADRTISSFYVQAGATVQIGEPRVNLGAAALPYEKTTDGVAYDFSLKGRNLLANSDLMGAAGSAPTGWTTGSVAGVTYGPDASVTFTASARFGGISMHHTVLPVGGRPFTASVDLTTNGGGRLLVYFYDHAGAYLGLQSSTTTNGRAVIQVNRTDVYRAQFRIEDDRPEGWTPVTFRRPMLELGLTNGDYQASARHSTLGANSGPDSSDPLWAGTGLTFDGVDDCTMPGAFSVPDGDFTMLHIFAPLVDSGAADGKALTSGSSVAGRWRTSSYLGPTSGGMNYKLGIYHVTGGYANSGFTYLNFSGTLAVGKAAMAVSRVGGLSVRAGYFGLGGFINGQTQTLPQAPLGGVLEKFGHTANVTHYYFAIYARALTDAEIARAYRVIRRQLSTRGITI